MQKIIKCTVSGEYVRGSGVVAGAAGSHDDVVLELAFKDIWEGTTKTAFWWDANGENPTATILTLAMLVPGETEVYRVPIPAEAKAYEGQMKLTLRGVVLSESGIVEQQATVSADAYFDILPGSVPNEYKDAMEVTPSVAEQIQAGVDALKGEFVEAQDAERQAIEAANKAMISAEMASASEENADNDAMRALIAADKAESYSINPPYPDNEVWHIWDGTKYVATNEPSRGEKGEKGINDFGNENSGKLLYVGADGIADVLGIGEGLQITDGIITVDGEFNPDAEESAVLSVARLGVMRLGSTGGNGGNSNVVGIESIEQTVTSTEDGGINEITATLTDGTTNVFHVKNGNKGSDGSNGKSAYEYAQDGGYMGTEEDFAAKMAKEYELPSASATVKGGVMVGKDLVMDGDTLNVAQTVQNKSTGIINLFPDNISFVLKDFRKCGQLCQFVIQFNITETINSSYSFAVFELPCKSVGRVWLNNATQYYIAANENVIRRNASQISTGNITLSGMYLTNE